MTQSRSARPPIDLQEALERAMGEKEFLEMLVAEFTDGLEKELEQLRAAIKQEDHETLTKHSHTLKGAAGNLSATALATAIKRLEAAGLEGDFQSSVQLIEDVESEAVRLRTYMAQVDWSGIN